MRVVRKGHHAKETCYNDKDCTKGDISQCLGAFLNARGFLPYRGVRLLA